MNYVFKYSANGFLWKKLVCAGHFYQAEEDRMNVYLPERKGVISIPSWSKYHLKLGNDWHQVNEKQASEEAGIKFETRG